ncbi:MAG: toll/interleukin-1 receptor domain-containing protein [Bacteroidota bacterium]
MHIKQGLKGHRKSKVFLSHSSMDEAFMLKIQADLIDANIDTWTSVDDINAGEIFIDKYNQGIKDCDFFLIIISEDSNNSKWVKDELNRAYYLAVKEGKSIIPVLYNGISEENIPEQLQNRSFISFDKEYDSSIRKLKKSIHAIFKEKLE